MMSMNFLQCLSMCLYYVHCFFISFNGFLSSAIFFQNSETNDLRVKNPVDKIVI